MTKFSIVATLFLLGSLLIGTCSNPRPASSTIEQSSFIPAGTIQASEYSISLPLITNKYPPIPIFGVESRSYDHKLIDANLYWMRINGIRWSDIQPTGPDGFDWQSYATFDNEIKLASSKGLQPILIVRSTPEWAQKNEGQLCGPIRKDHLLSFANFMSEVVKRYSRPPYNVQYFEIWNEPDAPNIDGIRAWGCWGEPTGDYFGGEYFAEMLKAVYPAMKSANPNIQVVLGGLLLDCDPTNVGHGYCSGLHGQVPQNWNFFEGVLKNGGGSAFDIVSFHGFAYYTGEKPAFSERNHPAWSATGGVVDGKLKYLRDLMGKYGVDKPIIQTEAALIYHDPPNALTDLKYQNTKADYIVWVMARNWAEGLLGTTWFSFTGWRGSDLVGPDEQPLPAYHALKNMATVLSRATFVSRDVFDDYERFAFRKSAQTIWLLIPTKGAYEATVTIDTPDKLVMTKNIVGDNHTNGDTIVFNRPIYLFFDQ
jgi:hypothetical protein